MPVLNISSESCDAELKISLKILSAFLFNFLKSREPLSHVAGLILDWEIFREAQTVRLKSYSQTRRLTRNLLFSTTASKVETIEEIVRVS